MAKIITVFGVTGNQGGSVARAMITDSKFKVRTAVRDISFPTATEFKQLGAEVVVADYNDIDSLRKALSGADGCFIVTNTDFTDPECLHQEIREGKNVADACRAEGVKHIAFSTQLSARESVGTEARHMDAKAAIHKYMQNLALPVTGIVVPFYYENLLGFFKPESVGGNEWRLRIPAIGQSIFDIISVNDVGAIVHSVFLDPQQFINKTIHPSGDKKKVREIADILSKHLRPKLITDGQMTYAEFKSLRHFSGAADIANQFDFISKKFQCGDMEFTTKLNPGVKNFEQWVIANKDALHRICQ
ncbi:nmrA-like family domain-containing protein 1 [Tubulanus polymorphus]|uniref:nmrA-like family domain-containing protein 1 n=1 Tax=Tubulanus polymorphus TaxID=672921 RepID=UPI003DA58EB4